MCLSISSYLPWRTQCQDGKQLLPPINPEGVGIVQPTLNNLKISLADNTIQPVSDHTIEISQGSLTTESMVLSWIISP